MRDNMPHIYALRDSLRRAFIRRQVGEQPCPEFLQHHLDRVEDMIAQLEWSESLRSAKRSSSRRSQK